MTSVETNTGPRVLLGWWSPSVRLFHSPLLLLPNLLCERRPDQDPVQQQSLGLEPRTSSGLQTWADAELRLTVSWRGSVSAGRVGHVSADDFVHCEDRRKRKTDLKLNFHHVPSSTNLIQSSLWMVILLLKRGMFILLPPGGSVVPRRVLPTSESSKHPELKVETKSQAVCQNSKVTKSEASRET